jgi:hypothetical protein
LCDKCIKKLMYKRMRDKEATQAVAASRAGGGEVVSGVNIAGELPEDTPRSYRKTSQGHHEPSDTSGIEGRRWNRSHSRSPRDRHRSKHNGRRRSTAVHRWVPLMFIGIQDSMGPTGTNSHNPEVAVFLGRGQSSTVGDCP